MPIDIESDQNLPIEDISSEDKECMFLFAHVIRSSPKQFLLKLKEDKKILIQHYYHQ